MSTEVTLRPVTDDDEAFLLHVYAGTRAEELARVPWTNGEKRDFVAMQYRAQRTDYESRFPGSVHSIILAGGVAVGRIWVGRRDDEIRLLDIALLPERRNQGTGRLLLERLIEEARDAGLPLRHSVYKANAGALRFYARLGFRVVEDYETHMLMEWFNPAA